MAIYVPRYIHPGCIILSKTHTLVCGPITLNYPIYRTVQRALIKSKGYASRPSFVKYNYSFEGYFEPYHAISVISSMIKVKLI